jgi:hypothetical protein
MEHWSEKLSAIESTFGHREQRSWMPAIEQAQQIWADFSGEVEVKVRVLYLLHHILVEEAYPAEEHDPMASLLERYFRESYAQCAENAEYLFFIGKILYVAEWYFGLDDDAKPTTDKLAFQMQMKAFQKEPDNPLYVWACAFSNNEPARSSALAAALLSADSPWPGWLKAKGFPGQYILEALEYCQEQYEQRA